MAPSSETADAAEMEGSTAGDEYRIGSKAGESAPKSAIRSHSDRWHADAPEIQEKTTLLVCCEPYPFTQRNLARTRIRSLAPRAATGPFSGKGIEQRLRCQGRFKASLWNWTTAEVDQVTHTEALGDFPQFRATSRDETAQQPIPAKLLDLNLPALGATAQTLENPGQLRRDRSHSLAKIAAGEVDQLESPTFSP